MNSKYPKTPYAPYSPRTDRKDRILTDLSNFIGQEIVLTEKIDGSNATLTNENLFARSHSHTPTHPSFDHLKSLHSNFKNEIREGLQLFGENTIALHSLSYNALPAYFLLFNIRDTNSSPWLWQSWDTLETYAKQFSLLTVPVLFRGIVSSEKELRNLTLQLTKQPSLYGEKREGVVVRVSREFADDQFSKCMMKVVSEGFECGEEHWQHKIMIKNKLK